MGKMRPRNSIERSTPRNTVTICLDDTKEQAQASYTDGIGGVRSWCLAGGKPIDLSAIFGFGHMLCTTRAGGTFYVVIEFEGRSLTFVIQGRDLHLRGWKGRGRSYELDLEDQEEKYILDQNCIKLSLGVNYNDLFGKGVQSAPTGFYALRNAFNQVWLFTGGEKKLTNDVREAIGTFAVHLSEAVRNQHVFNHTRQAFLDLKLSTLGKNPILIVWIKNYRSLSLVAMKILNCLLKGEELPPLNLEKYDLKITSVPEFLSSIRVLLRDACFEGEFAHEQRPEKPIFECPVDQELEEKTKNRWKRKASHKEISGRKRGGPKGSGGAPKGGGGAATADGGVGGPPSSFHPSVIADWSPMITENGGSNMSLLSSCESSNEHGAVSYSQHIFNFPALKKPLILDSRTRSHGQAQYPAWLPPSWYNMCLVKKFQESNNNKKNLHIPPPVNRAISTTGFPTLKIREQETSNHRKLVWSVPSCCRSLPFADVKKWDRCNRKNLSTPVPLSKMSLPSMFTSLASRSPHVSPTRKNGASVLLRPMFSNGAPHKYHQFDITGLLKHPFLPRVLKLLQKPI